LETTGGTDIVNVSCADASPAEAAAMVADAMAAMKTARIFAFLPKRNSFAHAGVTRQASTSRGPDKRNKDGAFSHAPERFASRIAHRSRAGAGAGQSGHRRHRARSRADPRDSGL